MLVHVSLFVSAITSKQLASSQRAAHCTECERTQKSIMLIFGGKVKASQQALHHNKELIDPKKPSLRLSVPVYLPFRMVGGNTECCQIFFFLELLSNRTTDVYYSLQGSEESV